MKSILVKEKMLQLKSVFDPHSVGNFNIPLLKTDRSLVKKKKNNTKEKYWS